MKCPKCQYENREGAKFCNECGNKLESACPTCGNLNRLGAKFCDDCGHNLAVAEEAPPKELSFDEKLDKIQRYLPKGLTEKILSQRDKIEGERKQVTVMFCDMEGFSALSERLGPEEAYTIVDQIYEILIHKVHDFEGTVNEMTGDGIVALFGAPIALEDAPQRAIRSALAIHREMVKFSDRVRGERQIPIVQMRIGIHTGPVVVGTVGNDLRVEFKAVGDTVNLASRMEEIAEAGTTYVTDDTFKLTEGLFRFEGLGDHQIKGKDKPVKVYRVLAPSSRRTRFDVSSERGLTPFIGRERELELLLDGFERAKVGRGQAFSIVAEAGIGKSRLLYEFRKAISSQDVVFLEGKSLSYSRNVAYHPVIDILKTNFRIRESDTDFDIKEKVRKGIHTLGADETSTLPYILELLSVKESGIDTIPLSPEAKKARTIEALKQIVLKGSELRPLIMAVEDLHWMDKSSEDAFKYLLEGIPGARVLLIFTYRPEFVHTWGGRSYHSQLNLNRLSNRESLTMLAHLLGTENIDKSLEERVLEKTEGVPFFFEEFTRSLKDLGMIEIKDGTFCMTEDPRSLTIPSRIQDVIMARVDSLTEGTKETLQVGSVIGREFSHKLIEEVSELPEQELLSRLSNLKDSELLYERGIYPNSMYVFKHALTQEAVYQSLLKNTCQKYHQLIAETFEQHFPEIAEAQPETLGHHLTEAGNATCAIPHWQKAGEIAIRRSANKEAVVHLNKGLELIRALPESHDCMKKELSLLIPLSTPLVQLKGQPASEVESNYLRARELCEKVGNEEQLFAILQGLRACYSMRADWNTSLKLSEQMLHLAKRKQDVFYLMAAHRGLGMVFFWLGELKEARSNFEEAIDLYDPQKHQIQLMTEFADPITYSLSFFALCLWLLGYPDKASQKTQEALNIAQKLNNSFSREISLFFTAWFSSLCGDIGMTQKFAKAATDLATEYRFPIFLHIGNFLQEWSLAMEEGSETNIDKMKQAMEDWRSLGVEQCRPYVLFRLAEIYKKVGQVEKGLNLLVEAQDLVNETREGWWKAELNRLKGEFLLSKSPSNHSEAESCFQQALDVARHQRAKSLELRASMSLSRLWQSQEKKEEAKRLLSKIYGWFTEGFDTSDLKEAKALLEELS